MLFNGNRFRHTASCLRFYQLRRFLSIQDMGRQESPQLIERKTQADTDGQETSRASKYLIYRDTWVVQYHGKAT